MRELMAEVLTGYGYAVLLARRAEEALPLAARHSGRLDLVISKPFTPEALGRRVREVLDAPPLPPNKA